MSSPPGSCVAFVDPSFTGGDYTALTVIRQYFDGVAVFGMVWKKAWYDCTDEIVEIIKDKGVVRLAFETNSLGEQPVSIMRVKLFDAEVACGVISWVTTENKHAKIMGLAPFAKYIYVSKDSHIEYLKQCKDYEYKAKNDDAPDSLASAMQWIGVIRPQKPKVVKD